jgi:hypothetical protein
MLTELEGAVRKTLIKVCRGEIQTVRRRKINYKALWEKHSPSGGNWGQSRTQEVVDWIVNISNYDVEQGRPPLNSLVVRIDTGEPGDEWHSWRKEAGSPYESLAHAQAACWAYWPEKSILLQFQSK